MNYDWDFSVIINNSDALLLGIGRTLIVVVLTTALGLLIGVVGGSVSAARVPVITQIFSVYVAVIRNTPLLLQIFFIYFGLPSIGITLSGFAAATLTLALWCGGYATENVRAGIESIDPGQERAARALGMGRARAFLSVVLPQGIRVPLASNKNTVISTLKNSSFMVAVGFAELTTTTMGLVSTTFRVYELFLFMGVVYLLLVFIASALLNRLQTRIAT